MIEDNANDEMLVRIALERQSTSYELIIARDGHEAIDCLTGGRKMSGLHPSSLSLILLDLKLPKLNGHEVLRRIRAEPLVKSVPVVIWTSSCEPADLVSSYDLGCNSYVQKPVDFDLFCDALRQITSYWLELNRRTQGGV